MRKMKEAGKKSSSVSDHVNKAISGDIAFISGTEEKFVLDQNALAQFLSEACNKVIDRVYSENYAMRKCPCNPS